VGFGRQTQVRIATSRSGAEIAELKTPAKLDGKVFSPIAGVIFALAE
jgi:hypothetical protein